MAELVYLLCMLTSAGCAFLLLRSYLRARTRLLLWSSLCFIGLALNNALLFVDLVVFPGTLIDLSMPRNVTALAALSLLVFGLVTDGD
jgi:hypothetical protein